MQSVSLNEKQSRELCDNVGNLLVSQLDSDTIRNKVNRVVADYFKSKSIDADPSEVAKNLSWSIKVSLKK